MLGGLKKALFRIRPEAVQPFQGEAFSLSSRDELPENPRGLLAGNGAGPSSLCIAQGRSPLKSSEARWLLP